MQGTMLEFYVSNFIRWFAIFSIFAIFTKSCWNGVKILVNDKIFIFIGMTLYILLVPFFINFKLARPFLIEKNLSELEISEGIGKVYHGGKFIDLYLDTDPTDFDFTLTVHRQGYPRRSKT